MLVAIVAVLCHLREPLPLAENMHIILYAARNAFLLQFTGPNRMLIPFHAIHSQTLASAYKIVISSSSPPNPTHVGTKVALYLLSALPEVVVTMLYLSINVKRVFNIDEGDRKKRTEKEMKTGTFTRSRASWSLTRCRKRALLPSPMQIVCW
jgi:hypothetical protein